MTSPVGHLLVGPRSHGVVRYAQSVFDAVTAQGGDHRLVHLRTRCAGVSSVLAECAHVHMHVTDRLFGHTPLRARDNLLAMIAGLRRPVSVTLHDLPGCFMQIAAAGVVTQSGPVLEDLIEIGRGQLIQRGETLHETAEVGDDGAHLGLLEHDLGDPYAVGAGIGLPGQIVAAMLVEPVQQPAGKIILTQ